MTHPSTPPHWLRFVPFFVYPPVLTERQWRILMLVALVMGFGAYDGVLLSLALPQIQRGLGISDSEVSNLVAIIRLGALPAFGVALAADWWGRRTLLLVSALAFSLLAGITALASTAALFVALQFLMRMFIAAAGLLATLFIVEEFPESARGWGIGVYSALTSVGGGVAALLFALVDVLPWGWRTLFLIGMLALLISPLLRTHLPETVRFQRRQGESLQPLTRAHATRPLLQLVQAYPGRLLVLGAVVIVFNLGGDAALFYDPTYLQEAHGWQPWQVSLLNLCAGFMAVLGSLFAGQWSDRIGRKRAAMLFLVGMTIFIVAYYNAAGWLLPLLWAGLLFTSVGAGVSLGTLSTELFPTSYRSTAAGATAVLATVCGALSLVVHGLLFNATGSPWRAVSGLALLILLAPFLLLRLPETSGRTLEEIAPER